MEEKYQSKILQVIHKDMKGLHRLGIISDAKMREFDEDCLVKEPNTSHKTAGSQSRPAGTGRNVRISAKGAN